MPFYFLVDVERLWLYLQDTHLCPSVSATQLPAGVFFAMFRLRGLNADGRPWSDSLIQQVRLARIPLISTPLCLSSVISSFKDQYVTPPPASLPDKIWNM